MITNRYLGRITRETSLEVLSDNCGGYRVSVSLASVAPGTSGENDIVIASLGRGRRKVEVRSGDVLVGRRRLWLRGRANYLVLAIVARLRSAPIAAGTTNGRGREAPRFDARERITEWLDSVDVPWYLVPRAGMTIAEFRVFYQRATGFRMAVARRWRGEAGSEGFITWRHAKHYFMQYVERGQNGEVGEFLSQQAVVERFLFPLLKNGCI
jgi:hypothetical protein